MLRFFITRLGMVIPTFIGVTVLAFFLIRLIPGDPIELMVGERGIDPARHAMLRAEMGLDKPIYVQYFIYISNVLQGDLGKSIVTKKPVMEEFLTLFSGNGRALPGRDSVGRFNRSPYRHSGGAAPGKSNRLCRHGHGADRLFDADLLVGPAHDSAVLGGSGLDAGFGSHIGPVLFSSRSPASC